MTNGINITNEVSVDWFDLGAHLATLGSDDQSALLDGFQSGLHKLGSPRADLQIAWIAESLGRPHWFVKELSEHLR